MLIISILNQIIGSSVPRFLNQNRLFPGFCSGLNSQLLKGTAFFRGLNIAHWAHLQGAGLNFWSAGGQVTGSVVQVENISGRPDAHWLLGSSFQNRSFQTQKTAAHTQFLTQGFFWCHLNIEARGVEPRHRLERAYHRERSEHQPSNPPSPSFVLIHRCYKWKSGGWCRRGERCGPRSRAEFFPGTGSGLFAWRHRAGS